MNTIIILLFPGVGNNIIAGGGYGKWDGSIIYLILLIIVIL